MAEFIKPRILIVDDCPTNVETLGELLEADYELFFALNGPDALMFAASQKPDLILLDVMMPEMDGFEVCRHLRKDKHLSETPIIFITALAEEQNELEALELGAVDYILKPFSASLVRLRIKNQLRLKLQRDELRRKSAELEAVLESEKQTVMEQRRFLELVSHELRTPLAIIDSAAQLLPLLGGDQEKISRKASSIRTAACRLTNLVDNYLADDRLADPFLTKLQLKESDIRSVMRNVVGQIQAVTENHRIDCLVDELPESFVCDSTLIETLLGNLLSNAIKYSPAGGDIKLSGWCGKNGALLLEVTDSGIGISPEQIERIFDRFYRIGQVPGVGGAGLGLHLIKQIAKLHGGSITCTSKLGHGATFTVRINPLCSNTTPTHPPLTSP